MFLFVRSVSTRCFNSASCFDGLMVLVSSVSFVLRPCQVDYGDGEPC